MARGVGLISDSGVPDTKEYRLGGGDVFVANLTSAGMPKNFNAIGNCPVFTLTATTETYEHDSVQGTVPVQDASVPIRAASTIGFTLENLSAQNLALFFLGGTAVYTNPAVAGFTDVVFIEFADIVAEQWYQLYSATDTPVFGITSTNSIVLESSAGTPVTMSEGTDYNVDAVSGKIFLIGGTQLDTILATDATDGKIQCTLTADGSATLVDQVTGLTDTTKEVAVHIQTKNAFDDDKETTFMFHKVSLVPDGDLNLITQEAATMAFVGQIQTNTSFSNKFDLYRALTQA